MPRTYHKKNIHTSPETAGEQNMTDLENYPKSEDNLTARIVPFYKHGHVEKAQYHGQWTDTEFEESVSNFFDFCIVQDLKPTKPLLGLWLGSSKQTLWEWETNPDKYGVKSYIIKEAFALMECYLQCNIDKYPTGSIFLLKTSHGHVEQSKLDITTNGGDKVSENTVADAIRQLGLDKPSETN